VLSGISAGFSNVFASARSISLEVDIALVILLSALAWINLGDWFIDLAVETVRVLLLSCVSDSLTHEAFVFSAVSTVVRSPVLVVGVLRARVVETLAGRLVQVAEVKRDHNVFTSIEHIIEVKATFMKIISDIPLRFLGRVVIRTIDDELLGSAGWLNDNVVNKDVYITDLELGPGLAFVPRVPDLLGGFSVGSSNHKSSVISKLVDKRNLSNLCPLDTTVS
jgi:hypothetical protein